MVAFGSAPGVPNWGGLLKRLVKQDFERHHLAFDILYIVDGARMWYSGAPCSDAVLSPDIPGASDLDMNAILPLALMPRNP